MQSMAELGFRFGITEGDNDVVHIPFDSQNSLFIFSDSSALFEGKTTMIVIPNIWDDVQYILEQKYTLENEAHIRLGRGNKWALGR